MVPYVLHVGCHAGISVGLPFWDPFEIYLGCPLVGAVWACPLGSHMRFLWADISGCSVGVPILVPYEIFVG